MILAMHSPFLPIPFSIRCHFSTLFCAVVGIEFSAHNVRFLSCLMEISEAFKSIPLPQKQTCITAAIVLPEAYDREPYEWDSITLQL